MHETVYVKPAHPGIRLPHQSSAGAAGWDIFAHTVDLNPDMGTATIGTGLKVAFPPNIVMCLFSRSGLGSNFGLVPANGTGIIDSDYRGEILIKFRDLDAKAYQRLLEMREAAQAGYPERIVQALFLPVVAVKLSQVADAVDLPATVRGEGGFGSTG